MLNLELINLQLEHELIFQHYKALILQLELQQFYLKQLFNVLEPKLILELIYPHIPYKVQVLILILIM